MAKQRFDFETPECVAAMYADGAVFERGPDYIEVFTGSDIPARHVPDSVTPRQIRLALNSAGLRSTVDSAVSAGSQDIKDWWEYALEIERNHPLINGMAAQLGVSDSQLDDLFRLAATL